MLTSRKTVRDLPDLEGGFAGGFGGYTGWGKAWFNTPVEDLIGKGGAFVVEVVGIIKGGTAHVQITGDGFIGNASTGGIGAGGGIGRRRRQFQIGELTAPQRGGARGRGARRHVSAVAVHLIGSVVGRWRVTSGDFTLQAVRSGVRPHGRRETAPGLRERFGGTRGAAPTRTCAPGLAPGHDSRPIPRFPVPKASCHSFPRPRAAGASNVR